MCHKCQKLYSLCFWGAPSLTPLSPFVHVTSKNQTRTNRQRHRKTEIWSWSGLRGRFLYSRLSMNVHRIVAESLCVHSVSLELDLKRLVELGGEGVCGWWSGALLRAVLQCGPLGLEGIGLLLCCHRLRRWWHCRPAVSPIKCGIDFWCLQCCGICHRR